jgi:AcrR family transcriptional regulator
MPRLITQAAIADFRSRLCEVAAELFAELGRDGFTMRGLAKRLQVSPMTAYRYFRDKEEILAAVRARAYTRLAERLQASDAAPSRERSLAFARAYGEFVLQEGRNYRLMFDLFQPHVPAVPELGLAQERLRAAMREHARLLIADGLAAGDAALLGQVIWSALHGVAALYLAGKLTAAEFGPTLTAMARVPIGGGQPLDEWPAPETPHTAAYPILAALPAAE